MKRFTLAVISAIMVFGGSNLAAQSKYGADSANCIKYLSYYTEYYKQKNYEDATKNWREAYRICPPTSRQGLLVDGAALVRKLITKNYRNAEYKAALIDSLMTLHDLRVQYYPSYAVTTLNNKGLDMINYVKNDPQRLYEGLTSVVAANGASTKPSVFINQFVAATDLYKAEKISVEEVMDTYEKALALLDESTDEPEQIAKVKADLESLFISSKVADCQQLTDIFTPKYEAAPDDLELATKIVKMLASAEECTDNDLYLKAVTTMDNLNPTSVSAYYLYKLHASRGNVAEAVSYLEKAIVSEDSDQFKDAEYNYEMAVFCHKNGQSAKAAAAARKSIDLNPDYAGKANYILGTIWGSMTCNKGGNEIERRAQYWVAVDYLQKAKAADESLAEDCNKLIGAFRAYFPQKAEAFMYDVTDGQSYTVSCGGLQATTVVRTQN